ncbi:hypothetical protein [Shewanella mangrovisoli]|uniref:hypothetical protein n=1 Tax=Shewanella mangrovisoli TaxID=2864211 RepID=UPI00313CA972
MINYVDGVCGSGKTSEAIKRIAKRVKGGETIIYATSTTDLLKQTMEGLEANGVEVELIISKSDSGYRQDLVSDRLKNRICIEKDNPRVILCVTKSLIKVASRLLSDVKLPLFLDEGFEAIDYGTESQMTGTEIQAVLYNVGLSDEKPKDYKIGNNYKLSEGLKRLSDYTRNPLYEVEFKVNESQLQWTSMLIISGFFQCFSEVTILSACFDDTLEYHAAKAVGIEMKALDWGLETKHYSNGVVHVSWVLSGKEWRTSFKDKLTERQLNDIADEFWREHCGDYLSVNGVGEGSINLPVKSHGINEYSSICNYLNLHTQMPPNFVVDLIKKRFSLTKFQIRKSYYHYHCYQSAMRTVLRKSSKDNPIEKDTYYCFGDKSTAMYFLGKLSNSVKVSCCQLQIGERLDVIRLKPRSDKISLDFKEQDKRRRDRAKLQKWGCKDVLLEKVLIIARDWRRAHTGKNLTLKILKGLVDSVSNCGDLNLGSA